MRFTKAQVERLLTNHMTWVDTHRGEWLAIRNMYSDQFWMERGSDKSSMQPSAVLSSSDAPLFEVNRLRPWFDSYVASLFYRGFKSTVKRDPVITDDEPLIVETDGVRALLDRWYQTEDFQAVSELVFTAGLAYHRCGVKLVEGPRKRIVDRLGIQFMEPWECVWDPRSKSAEDARYIGHLSYMSVEDILQKYGHLVEHPYARPDVIRDGWVSSSIDSDESYALVLELYQPKAMYNEGVRGVKCVYLLDQKGGIVEVNDKPTLRETAIPYDTSDGLPAVPIVPVVLTSMPEASLDGIPAAATVYNINFELNCVAAWLGQATKLDAARIGLADMSRLDAESKAALTEGIDHAILNTTGGTENVFAWATPPPFPSSMLQFMGFISSSFESTQGTAPSTRGEPVQYISATGDANLAAYSETKLGMLRAKVDRVVVSLSHLYLRALDALMADSEEGDEDAEEVETAAEASVQVIHLVGDDEKQLEVDRVQLGLRWILGIVDGPNTPAKTEKAKADIVQVAPMLQQWATVAASPQTPPMLATVAQRMYDELVKRFDMPKSLTWEAVKKSNAAAPMMPQAAQAPVGEAPGVQPATAPEAPVGPQPVTAPVDVPDMHQAAIDSDDSVAASLMDGLG